MPHRCGCKPFNSTAWNFVFPKGYDYTDVQASVEYEYCECDWAKHIHRHRIMKVHIKVDHVDIVRCNISFPKVVKLIQVFIIYPVWMGRAWRYVKYPLCTAFNPTADGCYLVPGEFSY